MLFFKKSYQYNKTLTIDFHTHILPGMDDGSENAEMSVQMIHSLNEQGINRICLTPHYYRDQNSIDTFLLRRETSIQKLFGTDCPPDNFTAGAEVAFFVGISREEDLHRLCFNRRNILLLEMPFVEWYANHQDEVVSILLDRGIQVILAHPERYLFTSSSRAMLKEFSKMSIAFQIDADTLVNRSTRAAGIELLEMSRLPLLGSDTHDMTRRSPLIKEAEEILEKKGLVNLLKKIEETGNRLLASEV